MATIAPAPRICCATATIDLPSPTASWLRIYLHPSSPMELKIQSHPFASALSPLRIRRGNRVTTVMGKGTEYLAYHHGDMAKAQDSRLVCRNKLALLRQRKDVNGHRSPYPLLESRRIGSVIVTAEGA